MEKDRTTCPWGDCPSLDRGPKSREHEERFVKRDQAAGYAAKNNALMAEDSNNAQNRAK